MLNLVGLEISSLCIEWYRCPTCLSRFINLKEL